MILKSDDFIKNKTDVMKDENIKQLLDTLTEIRDFVNDLAYLNFGRDYLSIKINANIVLQSATQTMESIRCCCMNGNFADLYTLLRKFRDDLFYYLYLIAVESKRDLTKFVGLDKLNSDEKNISDWLHNKQENLHISTILKYIASHPSVQKEIEIYGLKKSFNKISNNLNNYVHSNGYSFYNEVYSKMICNQNIDEKCKEISKTAIYITISFLFLLVLIRPRSIMSEDYIDYLDYGTTPPKDFQYYVAPFVSNFFEKNKNALNESIVNYLKEKTGMQI